MRDLGARAFGKVGTRLQRVVWEFDGRRDHVLGASASRLRSRPLRTRFELALSHPQPQCMNEVHGRI